VRVVAQRVSEAKVTVDGAVSGAISHGLLLLVAVSKSDTEREADWMAHKCAGLRVFDDKDGKLNLSVSEVGGAVLIVSQFTLYGDCRKGMRPSYDRAARPEEARRLYEYFVQAVERTGVPVRTGVFQADMKVSLINDGPVTVLLDSPASPAETSPQG
jgi:D-aminoacyl-tRNA deacylase